MNNRKNKLEICPQCRKLVRSDRIASHLTNRCEKRTASCNFSDIFPRRPVPDWLVESARSAYISRFPLIEILLDSCYYPASGLDASPVLIANGFIHSFVYVDYGVKKDDYIKAINRTGFRGYRCVLNMDVRKDDIVPATWTQRIPDYFDEWNGLNRLLEALRRCEPFAHWTIWQRLDYCDDRIGPPLFSFFFIGGEGVITYQCLYERNNIVPTILALIQPGHACGGNWTNFFDPSAPLWQSIEKNQRTPDYLLIGNAFEIPPTNDFQCPFSGYEFLRRTKIFQPMLTIWKEDCTVLAKILAESLGETIPTTPVYHTHYEWRNKTSHTIDIFKRL